MRAVTVREAVIDMFQETLYGIAAWMKSFKRQPTPSLLAYNVVWFTTCTWIEQIYAFDQLDGWIDTGKGSYLYK